MFMRNKSYFKTVEELKEFLTDFGYEGTIVLENPDYVGAVIGVDDEGRLVYSYDKMVQCLVDEDGMSYEEAAEFIDYNTIRALPYMGTSAPIVFHELSELMGEIE